MTIPYELIYSAFLSKITEFEFLQLPESNRTELMREYLKRAAAAFKKNCKYDLSSGDDVIAEFTADIEEEDLDELVEILSEGMVVQWLKPYVYRQELLENAISTKDFSTYSPAELLLRVGNAYNEAKMDYIHMIREYSYNHGDLGSLHL